MVMWHSGEQVSELADHVTRGHRIILRLHRSVKQSSTDVNPRAIRPKGAFAHQMEIANHTAMRVEEPCLVDE